MWKYQFIKKQYQQMQHLHSVHNQDMLTLNSKYEQMINQKKIQFSKQIKNYTQNFQKQTSQKLTTLQQSLKCLYEPISKKQVFGFDKYKKVDKEKQKQKYQQQVKVQLDQIRNERNKEFIEYKKKKEEEFEKEIAKLKKKLKQEENKILSNQEMTKNNLRFQQGVEKKEFVKANEKK